METVLLRPPPPDSTFKEHMRNRVFSDEGKPRNIFFASTFPLKKRWGGLMQDSKWKEKNGRKSLGQQQAGKNE